MEAAIGIGAARWAVGRALGPITSGLLEPWAASSALGTKIHELKMELLYAQGMLNNARAGRDVRNPALAQLLLELRQLAYLADDVLDELEYFRIQDELKGTFQTMDPEGLKGLLVHAQHTVKSHARKLKPPLCLWPTACHGDKEHEDGKQGCLSRACAHGGCMPKVIASSIRAVGNRLPCSHSRMSMQDDASDASNMPPMHGRRLPCAYKAQFPALKLDRLTTCNNEVGCMPKVITSSIRAVGKHLPCRSLPSMHDNESAASRDSFRGSTSGIFEHKTEWWAYEEQQKKHMVQSPSLNFDRVGMSRKMSDIVEKLKPICAKVSTILNLELLGFTRTTTPETPFVRPETTSNNFEPKIYGRETHINNIVYDITDVPWTSSLREINIEQVRSDFKELSYTHLNEPELSITGKGGRDSTFWNVVAFDFLLPTERDSNAHYKISVKWLDIRYCSASGKELTQIISHFPYLSRLDLIHCNRVSGLGVAVEEQPKMSTPASTSANKMDEAKIRPQPTQTAGVVLLPPHIQRLYFSSCPQLSHVSTSIGKGTAAGGGLEDLRSLQTIHIDDCPILMSSNASFHFLFPSSLQTVTINRTRTSLTLPHLPNLTNLDVRNAPYLRGEDLLPLLLQGKLTDLSTYCAPQFFVGLKAAKLCGIRTIRTHVVAGFLVNPICDILSSSLTRLFLENNSGLERFTKAQEKALHMLTSLQELEISFFSKLQSGPAGLSGELHSLKKLRFWRCEKLQSLPKDSIPTSLEVLSINHCPQLRSVPKDGLENSSLRGLVLSDVSDELEKQCRKLQGTIPVYREEH
ncbi:hypothetical protein ACQ4PT_010685 [Festuca glaucescens]